jgi:hypothetical protein
VAAAQRMWRLETGAGESKTESEESGGINEMKMKWRLAAAIIMERINLKVM